MGPLNQSRPKVTFLVVPDDPTIISFPTMDTVGLPIKYGGGLLVGILKRVGFVIEIISSYWIYKKHKTLYGNGIVIFNCKVRKLKFCNWVTRRL